MSTWNRKAKVWMKEFCKKSITWIAYFSTSSFYLLSAHFMWKEKYNHPVDDDQYSIPGKLAKRRLMKPVPERSKKVNSAVKRFWFG